MQQTPFQYTLCEQDKYKHPQNDYCSIFSEEYSQTLLVVYEGWLSFETVCSMVFQLILCSVVFQLILCSVVFQLILCYMV